MDLVARAERFPLLEKPMHRHDFQCIGRKGREPGVAAARLGHPVRMIGPCRHRYFGEELRAQLVRSESM